MKRITVPDIGDFKNVPVIELLVSVGDAVAKDQTVAVVESDKATLDIPSSEAGLVTSVDVKLGDRVSAGSVLLTLQSVEVQPSEAAVQAPLATLDHTPATPLVRMETDLIPTPAAALIPVHTDSKPEAGVYADNVVPLAPFSAARSEKPSERLHAGPAVRRLARELGVDLQQVKGTGPRGRIVFEDVRGYVKSILPKAQAGTQPAMASAPFALSPWPKVDFSKYGAVEARPLSRIRKISGANLHRNWVTIPHVTNHDDADVTELEAFRAELNREREGTRAKVSPLAFVMKACVAALKAFPEFNASLDGEQLILKHYFHIGFAADTPNGLVVPVIREADQKGVIQIATEMGELAAKARAGQLTGTDMQGGCFSISSLGGIGGSYFTPIINAPEVAILGVGKLQTRVVWLDGQAQPRLYLPLSLSWDHRVVDGAAAGRFNAYLVKMLGDLRRLLL